MTDVTPENPDPSPSHARLARPERRSPSRLGPLAAALVVVSTIAAACGLGGSAGAGRPSAAGPTAAAASGPAGASSTGAVSGTSTGASGTTGASSGAAGAAAGPGGAGAAAAGVDWASVDPANPLLGSAGSAATTATGGTAGPGSAFPGGLLIADRGNGRLLIVSGAGRILWRFPGPGGLPAGQAFSADDAFLSPDGKTIVANDESHEVIDRIDIATRRIVWQYGRYGVAGPGLGSLHTPDDSYPLANGDIVVADIRNCRVLEIAPDKSIVHRWGRTGVCVDHAPHTFGMPNGDTPLADGGILITEITGSRVVRLSAAGAVVFDVHVPVSYPSDAQLDANGNVVVADYASPGAVVSVSPQGKLLWRYAPTSGNGRLDHPSLATPLPGGLVSVNDDGRQRMVVIDPKTGRIVWQYGKTGVGGRGPGLLSDPDGHEPLPPGFHI